MKKVIFTMIITSLMLVSGILLNSCRSSEKKIDDAQDDLKDAENKVTEANINLDQAIEDSVALFKKKSDAKILAHQKSVAEFKARLSKEKKENQAKYEKEVARIDQQNSDMKKKLDEYKAQSKENWETFKTDFNKDMDDIGKAIIALSSLKFK